MNETEIDLHYKIALKWINLGTKEIISRFNLKPIEGITNYPESCFVKKNNNRYFRKHLGFTFSRVKNDYSVIKIKINDPKKLMLFRLKYEI